MIEDVVRALDAQKTHTSATLAAALDNPLELDDVAKWIRFDPHNYVRSLVAHNDAWELRLLCWQPKQSTSVHAHGSASCAFRVVRGSALESVLGQRDRMWAPGDVVREGGDHLIHQVANIGADSLVTLHAYSPALQVDAPSAREGRNVVIVGGGFSGAALAMHLLRGGRDDLRITMIERGPWLGRGLAYGVESSVFRLNCPPIE